MSTPERIALRDHLGGGLDGRSISDAHDDVPLAEATRGTVLADPAALSGRSVLLAPSSQLLAALAMIELDGVAARILLCPPDLDPAHLPSLVTDAGLDAVVSDDLQRWATPGLLAVEAGLPLRPATPPRTQRATEWLMLTSGTTGAPKIVRHALSGLIGAFVAEIAPQGAAPTWATFYDIRRYGGLQILLRAIIGGGSMVLSDAHEPVADFLARLARHGVTHLSGTPSHWRKAMMSGAIGDFAPGTVRLSGEIADQAVLDSLRKTFPHAAIGHAYASTEAGVGFAVNDGREGFPAAFVDDAAGGVEMKVEDGSLRIRSPRAARAYVGARAAELVDADGFIDTGDMVELRGDRYHFVGRRGGIINVGGLKVHPEEVEAVINSHDRVRMSRVRARRNPITGAVVVADIVLTAPADAEAQAGIRADIIAACRGALPAHKVPAMIGFVDAIETTPSGKLARPHG